ncbi:MAG: hypothetical protein WA940_00365 [Sphingopyxis sp.]
MADMIHRIDTKSITISIKLPRAFGIRMWVAIQLVKLAGLIAPVTIELEVAMAPEHHTPM